MRVTIPDPVLTDGDRVFLGSARRVVLATIGRDGRPRLVPVCFVVDPARPILYTPIDEKPKSVGDPGRLARVRDIIADPRVSVLVDRWEEDWGRLTWLRLAGRAVLVQPADRSAERTIAIAALRARYPQYASHDLEARPLIRVGIERVTRWGAVEDAYA